MQSKRVHCPQHSEEKRSWEITPEGKVWPCCYFGNAWDQRHEKNQHGWMRNWSSRALLEDPEFQAIMEEDSHWNDLNHHTLDDITAHKYYWSKIWVDGFNADPHPICQRECYIVIDEGTGEERSHSVIAIFDKEENK